MASEVKIDILTELITDTIRAQMVKQIGSENKDALVEKVVEYAMTHKKDSYSSTPTFFQQAVNDMIRQEALKVFEQWLENNRQAISAALFKHLNGNKQRRLKEFCEKLAGNISQYGIKVNLDLSEKNY